AFPWYRNRKARPVEPAGCERSGSRVSLTTPVLPRKSCGTFACVPTAAHRRAWICFPSGRLHASVVHHVPIVSGRTAVASECSTRGEVQVPALQHADRRAHVVPGFTHALRRARRRIEVRSDGRLRLTTHRENDGP